MHRLLLVEDSPEGQLILRRALAGPEIELTVVDTFKDANAHLKNSRCDLVILDLGLPDGDGLNLLEFLRDAQIPVFLFTSRNELSTKVTAFNLGAEDYLVKPVDPIELRARVEMRLRKSKSSSVNQDIVKRGDLTLDMESLRASVFVDGETHEVPLTNKELRILKFLILNENKVYSREELVNAVWGNGVHILARTVDSHIYGLRKKLGKAGSYIESVAGSGYRFKAS